MTNTELARAAQLNAQIKIEINANKVNIDRSIHQKSLIDRIAIKKAKILSKLPNLKLRNEFIKSFLDSQPRFDVKLTQF